MGKTTGRIVMGIGLVIAAIFLVGGLLNSRSGSDDSQPSSTLSPSQFVAPVTAASPASSGCTTNECIASGTEQSLPGLVAKDYATITKATCQAATVKHPAGGTYTVHCTATYSDGMVAKGIASVLLDQDKIAWEPTDILTYGNRQ